MEKWKLIMIGIILGALIILGLTVFLVPSARATYDNPWSECKQLTCGSSEGEQTREVSHYECPQGYSEIGNHCVKGPWWNLQFTDKVKVVETQTQSCVVSEPYACEEEPTPTPEPPCETNCGSAPTFQGSTTEAPAGPVCTGVNPDQPVGIEANYVVTGPTSASFSFWGGQADHYEIEYGYSKDNLEYGIPGGLPGNSELTIRSFEVKDLKPGFTTLFARVTAIRGGCVLHSEPFN